MTSVRERLLHVRNAIDTAQGLFKQRTFDQIYEDDILRLAYERLLEIISEASRHIPQELKSLHPTIPWRSIADTGNFLRHTYDRLDVSILRDVAENDLAALSIAMNDLIEKNSKTT